MVNQALNGVANYSWSHTGGPDAYFGGGAEQFIAGSGSPGGKDFYAEFAKKGYSVSWNKTALLAAPNDQKALGIFCKSNLPVWLDRNIFTDNLGTLKNNPSGADGAAKDLPGLKEMTLKAVDILNKRGGKNGFFLMSEAASIDKQMHTLDYDRALGDLLELDDTVRATIAKLKELEILDETLIVVSADHGHGFGKLATALLFRAAPFPLDVVWLTLVTRCLWQLRHQVRRRAAGYPPQAQRHRRVSELRPLAVHSAQGGRELRHRPQFPR